MAKIAVAPDFEKTLRKDSLETVDGDSVDIGPNDRKKPSRSTIILSLIIGIIILWIIILSSIAIHSRFRRKNKPGKVHQLDIIVEHTHYDLTNPDFILEESVYEDMSGNGHVDTNDAEDNHLYDEVRPTEEAYVTLLPNGSVQNGPTNDRYDTPRHTETPVYDTPRPAENFGYDAPKQPVPARPETGIRGAKTVKPPRTVRKPRLSPDNDPTVEVSGPKTYIPNAEFEDLPFLPVDHRCFKMTYVREIPGTGFSCRFIAKAAKIPGEVGMEDTYSVMYYWIYQRAGEYYIHQAGPYDGDHLINVNEEDFSSDNLGSFTLSGTSKVEDMEKLAAEGKLVRRYLNINQKTANFRNIADLYNMFRMRDRFFRATYGEAAQNSNRTISRYSKRILELSNCLYSL